LRSVSALILVLSLLFALMVPFYSIRTAKASSSVFYLDIPLRTYPRGITYCRGQKLAYVLLMGAPELGQFTGIAVVNVTKILLNESDWYYAYNITKDLDIHSSVSGFPQLDSEGNVWFSVLGSVDYHVIGKYIVSENRCEYVDLGDYACGWTVLYYAGYIWTVSGPYLVKVNTTTNVIVARYNVAPLDGCDYLLGVGEHIWITSQQRYIAKFNVVTERLEFVLDYLESRPRGIAYRNGVIYIAESGRVLPSWKETILMLNETTGEFIGRIVLNVTMLGPYGGTSILKFDSFGSLWFTDMQGYAGYVGRFANITFRTKGVNWAFEEIEGFMWFTGEGSAYIGITGIYKDPDINDDEKVDIKDIAFVAVRYGSYYGDDKYIPEADLNGDLKVDIKDIAYVAKWFGWVGD